MRERLCKSCGGWHSLSEAWPHNCRPPAPARSMLPAPMLIRDTMDAIKGMHDGRFYDSKSALRASYRAAGVEELGNDAPLEARDNSAPVTIDEVGEAYRMVKDGYKPARTPLDAIPAEIAPDFDE